MDKSPAEKNIHRSNDQKAENDEQPELKVFIPFKEIGNQNQTVKVKETGNHYICQKKVVKNQRKSNRSLCRHEGADEQDHYPVDDMGYPPVFIEINPFVPFINL
jgi:hypothetical protein